MKTIRIGTRESKLAVIQSKIVGDYLTSLGIKYELVKMKTTGDKILDKIWGTDFIGESRTIDMHVKNLRKKLGEEGSLIKTVRNVGYVMNAE